MTARATGFDSALLCSEPGCTNRWTSNFGRRYCGQHDPGIGGHEPTKRQPTLPSIAPANFQPHWSDTDHDQEASF